MPISQKNKKLYPKNWKEISFYVRYLRAKGKCEFCGAEEGKNNPITNSKVVLTVAHLDHNPTNCNLNNLKALCQMCHNRYDIKHRVYNRFINNHGTCPYLNFY